jgi:hypothetical protein
LGIRSRGGVGLGPLLRCVVRAALGGVAAKMVGLPLEASLLLGSDSLVGSPPLATRLSAVAPRYSEFWPFPAITENSSGMRERGVEILGRTWVCEEMPRTPAASFELCVETSRWEFGGDGRWRRFSLTSPSLRVEAACVLGAWHLFKALVGAGSSDVAAAYFPLLSRLSERKVRGALGAALEQCAEGTEGPLVSKEISLLPSGKVLAPPSPPPSPGLGLGFPNPKLSQP